MVIRWAAALALAATVVLGAGTARADDPDTTDEVCGAYNLGVPEAEIPGRLGANDGRENYWKAQRDTNWPIIEGDCG